MKKLRLLLTAIVLPWAASVKASPIYYEGMGSTSFVWSPFNEVEVPVSFRINEVHPDPTRADGIEWRSPKMAHPFPPPQTGAQLDLQHTYHWSLPGRDGTLAVNRRLESIDGRLVIRDSWNCEPTDDAFFIYEITVNLAKYPDATLDLVGAQPAAAPTSPRLADLNGMKFGFFDTGMSANVQGVRIGKVDGGALRLSLPQPFEVSLHPNTTRNEIRLRFMAPAPRPRLTSGEAIMTMEWTAVNS